MLKFKIIMKHDVEILLIFCIENVNNFHAIRQPNGFTRKVKYTLIKFQFKSNIDFRKEFLVHFLIHYFKHAKA